MLCWGVPGYSAYAATKAGVRAMTRNLASELAPRGIRVNQVSARRNQDADLGRPMHQRSKPCQRWSKGWAE